MIIISFSLEQRGAEVTEASRRMVQISSFCCSIRPGHWEHLVDECGGGWSQGGGFPSWQSNHLRGNRTSQELHWQRRHSSSRQTPPSDLVQWSQLQGHLQLPRPEFQERRFLHFALRSSIRSKPQTIVVWRIHSSSICFSVARCKINRTGPGSENYNIHAATSGSGW